MLTRYDTARGPHTEILCKRMSWIVAQTMVRQLVAPREGVDLIGALSHEASETFDRVGGLNVSMHPLRKRKKRERVLFVLSQTSHRFPDSVCCTWL